MNHLWLAFGLTLGAGMATGIGSALAFFARRTNHRFLSITTGFSAGVMLYVAFVEIYVKGSDALSGRYGDTMGAWITAAAFFGGMALIGLIDVFVPTAENPHEVRPESAFSPLHEPDDAPGGLHGHTHGHSHGSGMEPVPGVGVSRAEGVAPLSQQKLMRMGLFTALAIGIHNFPEGLATFLAALEDPHLGVAIAVAIALHNIPEGISVSIPIYYATGDRRKAFLYSVLSGLAEPIGALVGYAGIRLFLGDGASGVPPEIMGVLFGGVAGIMVYISLDELLPTSRAYGRGHDSLLGLVAGMVVMALSLLLTK